MLMYFISKSSFIMFPAFSQHVFFRHARARTHNTKKSQHTACNDQSSHPLIYRIHMPFHILERLFIIFQCFPDILIMFATCSDKLTLFEPSPKIS